MALALTGVVMCKGAYRGRMLVVFVLGALGVNRKLDVNFILILVGYAMMGLSIAK